MPQYERSPAEQTSFDTMLMSTNLLYLGGTVLVLLDEEYAQRFWTSAEYWLSTQVCTPSGLQPADSPDRCKVVLLPGTPKELQGAQATIWASRTIEEACALLGMKEVSVTSEKDKEKLIPKLRTLHEDIRGAWAAMHEAELKQVQSGLEDLIERWKQKTAVAAAATVQAAWRAHTAYKALALAAQGWGRRQHESQHQCRVEH